MVAIRFVPQVLLLVCGCAPVVALYATHLKHRDYYSPPFFIFILILCSHPINHTAGKKKDPIRNAFHTQSNGRILRDFILYQCLQLQNKKANPYSLLIKASCKVKKAKPQYSTFESTRESVWQQ